MSELTAKLLRFASRRRSSSPWMERLGLIADRLVEAYGIPRLGNFRDPVREIFYILLSAKTTDSQYRKTFRTLNARFPSLSDLPNADESEILSCIHSGGLANKKASQIKRAAGVWC